MYKKRTRKNGRILSLVFLLFSLLIFIRLFDLYLTVNEPWINYKDPKIEGDYYRGTIYDRNNNILALDVPSYEIVVNTDRVNSPARVASIISDYTSLDTLSITNLLSSSQREVHFESTIVFGQIGEFNSLVESEGLKSAIRLERGMKRINPLGDHQSEYISNIETEYDKMLESPLVLEKGEITGDDLTLSLDMDIFLVSDNIVSSYNEEMMIAVLGKNDGGIRAISTNSTLDPSYMDILSRAYSEGRAAKLVSEEHVCQIDPISQLEILPYNGNVLCYVYGKEYIIVGLSPEKEALRSAITELIASVPDLSL